MLINTSIINQVHLKGLVPENKQNKAYKTSVDKCNWAISFIISVSSLSLSGFQFKVPLRRKGTPIASELTRQILRRILQDLKASFKHPLVFLTVHHLYTKFWLPANLKRKYLFEIAFLSEFLNTFINITLQ